MRRLLVCFFCFMVLLTYGQQRMEHAIEYRQKLGFLAAHRGVMAHMPKNAAVAGEFSYVFVPEDLRLTSVRTSFLPMVPLCFTDKSGIKSY